MLLKGNCGALYLTQAASTQHSYQHTHSQSLIVTQLLCTSQKYVNVMWCASPLTTWKQFNVQVMLHFIFTFLTVFAIHILIILYQVLKPNASFQEVCLLFLVLIFTFSIFPRCTQYVRKTFAKQVATDNFNRPCLAQEQKCLTSHAS